MRNFGRLMLDIAVPLGLAGWVAYLAHGALVSAVGFRVLGELQKEAATKEVELAEIRAHRLSLERRADLLSPHSLDPDALEDRIRGVLGYAREGDIVLPTAELERVLEAAKRREQ
jgi:cell division protein FtsB